MNHAEFYAAIKFFLHYFPNTTPETLDRILHDNFPNFRTLPLAYRQLLIYNFYQKYNNRVSRSQKQPNTAQAIQAFKSIGISADKTQEILGIAKSTYYYNHARKNIPEYKNVYMDMFLPPLQTGKKQRIHQNIHTIQN